MLHANGEPVNSLRPFLNTRGAFSPCICTQTVRYTSCLLLCTMHALAGSVRLSLRLSLFRNVNKPVFILFIERLLVGVLAECGP